MIVSRRNWLKGAAATTAAVAIGKRPLLAAGGAKAQIAITLDLEMSRNFPQWDDTHWDYEKGNLDEATKRYAVAAGDRVRAHGSHIHYFCVGRVLEQADVAWLKSLARDGHPIGNHTYDHVNILAKSAADSQFRFQRAPWLVEGRAAADVIRENIRMTTHALRERLNIDNVGFRTPGGFHSGLHNRQDLQEMLIDLGFGWVSSLYPTHANTQPMQQPTAETFDSIVRAQAAAQPFVYPSGLIEIPMSPISDIGAFRTGRWKLEWFLEAVGQAVAWAIDNRAVFDFLAHPSCLGVVDPQLKTIDLICKLVKAAGDDAQLVTLQQVATQLPSQRER